MFGPYVHRIDPVLLDLGHVYFWWYGLSYALGFLEVHLFLLRARDRLSLSRSEVYSLSLLFMMSVLAGGRLVEVTLDERPFYRQHPGLIPALWLGGMASHGLLVGAAASVLAFSLARGKCFRSIADELVIPGAFLLGLGRVGNFIDGQIVGRVTDVWWAVQFPYAEGFRHPVVLYDGAKNLLLVPLLLWVRRSRPVPGTVAAHFVFWYAFLRFFVDLFRNYPARHPLGVPTAEIFNVAMTLAGVILLVRAGRRQRARDRGELSVATMSPVVLRRPERLWLKRVALAGVLLFSLTIPGNWTQDVPAWYGARHPGLHHSLLYPRIDTAPDLGPPHGSAVIRNQAARNRAGCSGSSRGAPRTRTA